MIDIMNGYEIDKIGLIEMDSLSLREKNGGLIMVNPKLMLAVAKSIIEPYQGAYEAGQDAGESNCECQLN